jgi:hypothetical protein
MSASDRPAAKQSVPGAPSIRSNARQAVERSNGLKASIGAGREPARQSPPRKLGAN